MKLTASLIVRNERARLLEPCVDHLLEFVDEVRILDDGSDDGWIAATGSRWDSRVVVLATSPESHFYEHEGRARQRLLDFTLRGDPSHVIQLDADEFIADGPALRRACETSDADALLLCMMEVWNCNEETLELRQDGGWAEHDIVIVWRPDRIPNPQIADRALACGRVPTGVGGKVEHACTAILHFGWANRAEREARHHRYVVADGGRFHARAHLDSILLPDRLLEFSRIGWPEALVPYRERILAHAGVGRLS